MKEKDDGFRKMEQQAAEVLDDWIYPNAEYGGGGSANDLKFLHAQYGTADLFDQVRDYYWEKSGWPHSRNVVHGGSIYSMREYPKRFFRNGPPMIVVDATQLRTISIFGVPSDEGDMVTLYITFETH